MDQAFLKAAVDEALDSVGRGGGPFGAVVVRDGTIIARGQNRVTATHDPTAHAEVVAIRAACAALRDHRLSGATLYASTEPCPMCLAASYWARLDRVLHAATRDDAARAGFDDAVLYEQFVLPAHARSLPVVHLPVAGATEPFERWAALATRVPY
jgi:guanine deaminase